MKKKKYTVGVDLGGTNIKIALVDNKGTIVNKTVLPTIVSDGPAKIIDRIVEAIKEVIKDISFKSINGIGIGAAGEVDSQRGVIVFSPNLFWENVPVVSAIKKKIKLPVILDNDANAAAWYMYKLGPAKGVDNLLCITLGTGVGGGIIIDKKLYRGSRGKAGEVGHIILFPDGLKCNCGNYGCLERYVGAPYIVERAVKRIKKGEKTIINDMVSSDLSKITPYILEKAAKKGDKLSLDIWKETGEYLGAVLANIITLLDLEMVLFCGGVSNAGKFLFASLEATLKERVFGHGSPKFGKLIFTALREEAGVIGAALLCC